MSARAHFTMPNFAALGVFLAVLSAASLLLAPSPAQAAPRSSALTPAAAPHSSALTPAAAAPRSAALSSAAAALHHSSALARAPLSPAEAALLRGKRIVAAAGAQRGKPYRRGASGPGAFDCSGLSGYAYRAAHIRLPRTAHAQYRAAHPISRATARPGDLVFWVHGRRAYHVAVYAGAGRVWHAPKPGNSVRLAKIWNPGQVRFGRIAA